jgi:hypothetical protein
VPLNGASVSANSNCQCVGFLAATFVNATTGWIVNPCGQGPAMWETIDGGSTWRPSKLATPPGGWERGVVPMAAPLVVTASGAVIDQVSNRHGCPRCRREPSRQLVALPRATAHRGHRSSCDPRRDRRHTFALPASDGIWVSSSLETICDLEFYSVVDLATLGLCHRGSGSELWLSSIPCRRRGDNG